MKPNLSCATAGEFRKNLGHARACAAEAILGASFLLAAFGAVDASAAGDGGVLAAMALFDRAYIPALSLSNQGRLEQAKKALSRLEDERGRFKREYGSHGGDGRWGEALLRVGDTLSEAATHLDDGELPKAHEAFEKVRDEFLRLREERSMVYYIDHLNRYHEAMEEVLLTAVEAGIEGLDAALFGFDGEKTRELKNAVSAVGKSLDALRAAFCGKDSEAVIKAAQGLRPPNAKTFLMFGDFSGLE
jgi:soluble cytochrome b562